MPYMSKGHILFEKSGQAPAPSKDFHQLLVTETEVLFRSWRISLRKDQLKVPPSQKRVTHEDFRYDAIMEADITRIFGCETLHYIQGVIFGDWLIRMPENVLLKIVHGLELTDLIKVSQVCKTLRKVCSSDDLWQNLYAKYSGKVTDDMKALARDFGWKKLFFTNKLQLQKEVSRLRKSADSKKRERQQIEMEP